MLPPARWWQEKERCPTSGARVERRALAAFVVAACLEQLADEGWVCIGEGAGGLLVVAAAPPLREQGSATEESPVPLPQRLLSGLQEAGGRQPVRDLCAKLMPLKRGDIYEEVIYTARRAAQLHGLSTKGEGASVLGQRAGSTAVQRLRAVDSSLTAEARRGLDEAQALLALLMGGG